MGSIDGLVIHPVTRERWGDLEALFGPKGAYSGCWCMWNRQTNREFDANSGDENRERLRSLVMESDDPPGLLAYLDGRPVGWVAVAPRTEYGRLARSPVTKPIDDVAVWSVTCFVIDRKHRGLGVGSALLEAAVEYARDHGAPAVEGYPVEPKSDQMPDIYAWMGLASMFEKGGFEEKARRSKHRPFMRLSLDEGGEA